MNPLLDLLQPYPFEKLRALFNGVKPVDLPAIRLSIGEPQHATPDLIFRAMSDAFSGLAVYPTTAGTDALRQTIADWTMRRYRLPALDWATQVLPVNGSREALFSFAQAVVDASKSAPLVVCPNPFYQIYEGAALLAGAQPVFLNQTPENDFGFDLDALSADEWARVQLFYVCSPGNPTGRVLSLDEWKALFELSDKYGFVIAADECYSEIYFDEALPPLGALEAAHKLGRSGFPRLVVFSSLSKRSNVPGLRSGFVAGDAKVLAGFLKYRTYHGCAMSTTVQAASIAAWKDEEHVRANRVMYREKFDALVPLLSPVLEVSRPDAGFYLWARTAGDDAEFARDLLAATNVTVLPGQYLARQAHGRNPGQGFIRIALVATGQECLTAAQRIVDHLK
ncbi:succinyldiaminopimelate transaminase [Uliginosibacterium aquaticum]|uniref:Succinyldiaminopimelate transaminase n=1 Tax=Uliginosibacterium aquaticum TaxID=2731212 RepID=A0ABX2IJ45_9RHOO|nr:succinyldiaminopimelate transaminase [Uliginosibacterium aquaticum]NSL56854.1 succinyldiaminopimelate transaminase [Uliginosibacterium aquaticum]